MEVNLAASFIFMCRILQRMLVTFLRIYVAKCVFLYIFSYMFVGAKVKQRLQMAKRSSPCHVSNKVNTLPTKP